MIPVPGQLYTSVAGGKLAAVSQIDGAQATIPDATATTGGKLTDAQAIKFNGIPSDAQSASQVTATANAVRLGSRRYYASCADVRSATTPQALNTQIEVPVSGVVTPFNWSASSEVADTGAETTSSIQITGTAVGRFLRVEAYAATQISSAITAIPDGSASVRGMITTAQAASISRALEVDQKATATGIAMASGATVPLIALTLTGLSPSTRYAATVSACATIWRSGASGTLACLSLEQDVDITTDGAGVATCTLPHTAAVNSSKCTAIPSALLSVAASVGGVTVSGVQSSGNACKGAIEVMIVRLTVIA
jgi:hypothetical protein